MSCAARMHDVTDVTMESGVMHMGGEPGRKTSILEHGLIICLIVFF